MAGIYLHIPFCKQACHYCNFHFSTSLKTRNDFVAALLKETGLQQEYLNGEPVETIYLGGGTPSLLDFPELQAILEKLYHTFNIAEGAEITLEANPDDMDLLKIKAWKKAGINRLSIGIQSFFNEDLRWMNRAHNALQAIDSIEAAQAEGFSNISIDLIYGGPTLSDEHWQQNVEQAIALQISHLSCYALTVEPKTALSKMIAGRKTMAVNPDDQARQFLLLMQWLEAAGYEHYEISNFARPGKRSRHNTAYWSAGADGRGKKYLGLGPSAHSYNGTSRQWNISNNAVYIQSINENRVPFEKEELTTVQTLNEYIMTSLRTMEGISLDHISEHFGSSAAETLVSMARPHIGNLKLKNERERLVLTREGKLFADGIAADLFFEG